VDNTVIDHFGKRQAAFICDDLIALLHKMVVQGVGDSLELFDFFPIESS